MVKRIKNISIRQALIIFVLMMGSPTIRVMPAFTIKKAGQAAWLAVVPSIAIMIIYFLVAKKIFSKYEDKSFLDIMGEIFGEILGKALGIIYILYITFLAALYIRFYAERLTASLSIGTSYIVFTGIMLVFLSFILKYDLPVLARANEIMLWMVVIPFVFINLLMIPKVKISNFYPVTHSDAFPVLDGGLSIMAVWCYITFLLVFSDRISNKKRIFKLGIKALALAAFLTSLAICLPLGIFGTAVKNLVHPYISAVQTISLFDTIERVEAAIVAMWIVTDFSIISAFTFSGLHALKTFFRLSDSKPLINIYIVALFFLSVYLAKEVHELNMLSAQVIVYVNLFFGFAVPFIMFFVGKLRKKL